MATTHTHNAQREDVTIARQTPPASRKHNGKRPTGLRTHQPVNNHKDLLDVTDGLLEEMGLDWRDTGGKVTLVSHSESEPLRRRRL
jgi:hypothetical protein